MFSLRNNTHNARHTGQCEHGTRAKEAEVLPCKTCPWDDVGSARRGCTAKFFHESDALRRIHAQCGVGTIATGGIVDGLAEVGEQGANLVMPGAKGRVGGKEPGNGNVFVRSVIFTEE